MNHVVKVRSAQHAGLIPEQIIWGLRYVQRDDGREVAGQRHLRQLQEGVGMSDIRRGAALRALYGIK